MQLARWWSLNNAENSSDFAFLGKMGRANREVDVTLSVKLCHVCHFVGHRLLFCGKKLSGLRLRGLSNNSTVMDYLFPVQSFVRYVGCY